MPCSAESPRPHVPAEAVTAIAALAENAVAEHRTSGVTWAIIGGHAHDQAILAHGAAGHRELADGRPAPGSSPMDRATVSRIASMTKSFTSATILALRDEGRLSLDDPISAHVPEAEGAFELADDDREPTLRRLLTMDAGLITDNPWGDRQEAMTREGFAAVLRSGLGHVHRPGDGFEYSNTGYALLGRVIDEVTGSDYATEIRRRFLDPLGLTATGWSSGEIDTGRLATGHRLADRTDATRFEAVPLDSPGVYGAMAGLFSSVDDVATWVRFLAAADAPDSASRGTGPLATASRREMQQLHRHQALAPLPAGEDQVSPGFDRVRGYGFGLVVEHFPDLGEVISHSGGYPGYGSFMVWHRDSGVGVVALANSKYAPATPLSMQALRILQREAPELLARRAPEAAPRTLEAARAALDWLRTDEDALADAWFADNMDLDVPRAERRRRLEKALAATGLNASALEALRVEDAQVLSRARMRWTVPARSGAGSAGSASGGGAAAGGAGAAGGATSAVGAATAPSALQVELLMDPRREGLVQSLDTIAR